MEKSKSFQKLKKLSVEPVDLTKTDLSTRIKKFVYKDNVFSLFLGLERIDESVLEALYEFAKTKKVIQKMHDMQNGEIINSLDGTIGEERSVLHTAVRDFFSNKNKNKKALEASSLAFKELEKLKVFCKKNDFENIIQIGIGGSIVGVKCIFNALGKSTKNVYFVSNVDPDDISSVLKKVDLSKTLIIIVSKSGTTLETLTNEAFVLDEIEKNGLDPKNHIVAITAKNSKMDDKKRYLEVFYIWDFICGRFSPTSMVGGVLIASCFGIDKYTDILRGANYMDKMALLEDVEKNLPLMKALLSFWNRNFLNIQSLACIPYSKALNNFIPLLQQYDMESNGKSSDKQEKKVLYNTGPIVFGDVGSDSQHTFFQWLHQGSNIAYVEFIGFINSQNLKDKKIEETTSQEKLLSNLFAQALALAKGKKNNHLNKNFEGNRPSSILIAKKLDPFTLGALLAYYEHKIAFQGFLLNINSFDQEGVELGKKLSKKMMDIFKGKNSEFKEGLAFYDSIKNLLDE